MQAFNNATNNLYLKLKFLFNTLINSDRLPFDNINSPYYIELKKITEQT